MRDFEHEYAQLIFKILEHGDYRPTRNVPTRSLFGMSLIVDNVATAFPLIQGRKMFPKGIFGEFAAFVRQPKHVDDFEKWGCNYWKDWADEDGSLNIDYGNAWFNFGNFNQVEDLKAKLRLNPTDRRMIINSWIPPHLADLSLPCCHYSYQFYVRENKYLDMIWIQRSVDMMVGLPSDIVLAALFLITLGNEFGYKPGRIKMDLGDCHVYENHINEATEYIHRVFANPKLPPVLYEYKADKATPFEEFTPDMLWLGEYSHLDKIDLELNA